MGIYGTLCPGLDSLKIRDSSAIKPERCADSPPTTGAGLAYRSRKRRDADAMRRFNQEAASPRDSGYPGIPVLYFGADEGELFMVMEHGGPATEAPPWERHLDSRYPQSVIDD